MTTTLAPPTTLEFWNASEAVYTDDGEGIKSDSGPPASTGLTLLLDSGQINSQWISDGFFAQAFLDSSGNIVVSFEGSAIDFSLYSIGSLAADEAIASGQTPQAFRDAYAFTADVQQYALQHGLGANPIYLTGHSLGGAEAEYVASLDDMSGVTFGAPGTLVPTYKSPSPGQSFVNYVDFGDPIGNFGFHFGAVDNVGSAQNQVTAEEVGDVVAAALFHPLANYKTDLNLGPPTVFDFNSDQTADGTTGNDSMVGIDTAGNDNDIIYGHQGDDIITFNNALNDSTLYGGHGNDVIEFTSYDVLYGNRGDDIVIDELASSSSTGASVLYGGQGDDTLVAFGAGDDTMYGGIGNNLFVSNSLGGNTAVAADQLTTVGVWRPANDLLSMSQVYGTGVTGVDLAKESDSSATSPAAALTDADTFYQNSHAHTFLLIYGGSEDGAAVDYLFYDGDNNVSPGVATDGMILIGDNAAGDVNSGNIINSRFA